jgi:hypothetical protein
LTARQRRFLEKELGVRLAAPPLRRGDIGLRAAVARLRRAIAARLDPPFSGSAGRPVADEELDPDEIAFLEAVRAEIRSGAFSLPDEPRPFGLRFRMAARQGRPLVKVAGPDGSNEYRVARDHRLVRRMIERCAASPAYLFPALALLAEGHDGYADNRAEAGLGALSRLR